MFSADALSVHSWPVVRKMDQAPTLQFSCGVQQLPRSGYPGFMVRIPTPIGNPVRVASKQGSELDLSPFHPPFKNA
jgi:hypothetical protein